MVFLKSKGLSSLRWPLKDISDSAPLVSTSASDGMLRLTVNMSTFCMSTNKHLAY